MPKWRTKKRLKLELTWPNGRTACVCLQWKKWFSCKHTANQYFSESMRMTKIKKSMSRLFIYSCTSVSNTMSSGFGSQLFSSFLFSRMWVILPFLNLTTWIKNIQILITGGGVISIYILIDERKKKRIFQPSLQGF